MIGYHSTGLVLTSSQKSLVGPFTFAYLSVDTVFYAYHKATEGKFEYIVHHILALWVILALLNGQQPLVISLIPDILLCELSTILYLICWVMKSTSYKNMTLIKILEISYGVAFFVTRIFNLPMGVLRMWPVSEELGLVRFLFIPAVCFQFFSFYKIVLSIIELTKPVSVTAKQKV